MRCRLALPIAVPPSGGGRAEAYSMTAGLVEGSGTWIPCGSRASRAVEARNAQQPPPRGPLDLVVRAAWPPAPADAMCTCDASWQTKYYPTSGRSRLHGAERRPTGRCGGRIFSPNGCVLRHLGKRTYLVQHGHESASTLPHSCNDEFAKNRNPRYGQGCTFGR